MPGTRVSPTSIQVGSIFDCIVPLLEPVGAKAPSFSTDSKGSIFVREIGQGFALLCQAQASPIPVFR